MELPPVYPFTAIVDQAPLKTALVINAVDPSVGGVLIRGQKGSGKSTAARALARLLPDVVLEQDGRPEARPMPLVELPLSATEDRLVGTLHIEHALKTGERRFEPGLLADAHQGILYVDEVNLLPDHLVDILLDAAASGVNIVEREGVSYSHPARFMLIGTMNPEEGDLRPQFLDRFGLCVQVQGLNNLDARREVVRRRLAFDRDPVAFIGEWREEEAYIADRVMKARTVLEKVDIPDRMLDVPLRMAMELDVHGHRADLAMLKAARAHAALLEKDAVGLDDLGAVADFVLRHRMRNTPLGREKNMHEQVQRTLEKILTPEDAPRDESPDDSEDNEEMMPGTIQMPGYAGAGGVLFDRMKKKRKKSSSTLKN